MATARAPKPVNLCLGSSRFGYASYEYHFISEVSPIFNQFIFRVSEKVPAIVFTALAGAFGWALLAGWL
jgi:hypothetical protein